MNLRKAGESPQPMGLPAEPRSILRTKQTPYPLRRNSVRITSRTLPPFTLQEGIVSIARRSLQWFIAIVMAGGLLLSPRLATPAHALGATWYVATPPLGSDGYSCDVPAQPCATINGAIAKAAAGDTVKVAIGTYTAPSAAQVVLVNKSITLSGGWNAAFTLQAGTSTVDGATVRTGIYVQTRANVVEVDHFTVKRGYTPADGGGILVEYDVASFTLRNSSLIGNRSSSMGGGLMSFARSITISDSTFIGNVAGRAGSGGDGGGIMIFSGSAVIRNTTLTGNKILGSSTAGSAISAGGQLLVDSSTITGNTGADAIRFGGTFYTFTLNNSTITGNTGLGAIISTGQAMVISNSTIVDNIASLDNTKSGGINMTGYGGFAFLRNTILAGNKRSDGMPWDCQGPTYSRGYVFIGSRFDCAYVPSTGDQIGTRTAPKDPRLAPLQNNGGPTFTRAPLPGSPVHAAGNPAAPGSGMDACLPNDQRGLSRPLPGEGICDIGAYQFQLPAVTSVNRLDLNPASSPTVDFAVQFSTEVTGVDTAPPFNDFALTTTGVTGAAVSAVSGYGSTYTVAVSTGTGNGTIRLDVADNDTIVDSSGKPLGGVGLQTGRFTDGQVYSINKAALPRQPASTIWDTTPTFKWTLVRGAPQYRIQVVRGTSLVYTRVISSAACTSTFCAKTPTIVLPAGLYKWRVQTYVAGTWLPYTRYQKFTLRAPLAGYWDNGPFAFYVSPDRVKVYNIAMTVRVDPCGAYRLTHPSALLIKNGSFEYTSTSLSFDGGFGPWTAIEPRDAYGFVTLKNYFIPNCGYVSGGGVWNASWVNSSQPAAAALDGQQFGDFLIVPMPDAPFGFFELGPVQH